MCQANVWTNAEVLRNETGVSTSTKCYPTRFYFLFKMSCLFCLCMFQQLPHETITNAHRQEPMGSRLVKNILLNYYVAEFNWLLNIFVKYTCKRTKTWSVKISEKATGNVRRYWSFNMQYSYYTKLYNQNIV